MSILARFRWEKRSVNLSSRIIKHAKSTIIKMLHNLEHNVAVNLPSVRYLRALICNLRALIRNLRALIRNLSVWIRVLIRNPDLNIAPFFPRWTWDALQHTVTGHPHVFFCGRCFHLAAPSRSLCCSPTCHFLSVFGWSEQQNKGLIIQFN